MFEIGTCQAKGQATLSPPDTNLSVNISINAAPQLPPGKRSGPRTTAFFRDCRKEHILTK